MKREVTGALRPLLALTIVVGTGCGRSPIDFAPVGNQTGAAGASDIAGAPGTAGIGTGVSGTTGNPGVPPDGTGGSPSGMQAPEGWVNRTPSVLPNSWPSPRQGFGLVADDASKRMILYGGFSTQTNSPLLDTWAWSGITGVWTRFDAQPPGVTEGMVATYDQRRNRTVIFGGEALDGSSSSDLWLWSFGDPGWTMPPPSSSAILPFPGVANTAIYDYALDRVLIQGGEAVQGPSKLWEWAVGSNTWTDRTVANSRGPDGSGAFAWDPRRSVGVFFGGTEGNELWQWDAMSGNWAQVPATAQAWPAPRISAALVLDRDRGAMMLFGGLSGPSGPALNDLWQWYPDTGWKLVDDGKSGHAPPPRFGFGMTYDPTIARLVLFGGAGDTIPAKDGGDLNDVWTYQGGP
jgi:Galactose oxidase, central domain/Kelch motif